MNVSIYIADGNSVMRDALKSILSYCPAYFVTGDSGRGDLALTEIKIHRPEVVIADTSLPVIDGWIMAGILRNIIPETRIILMSMNTDVEYLDFAATAGINGYMLKDEADNLPSAIDVIMKGGRYISPVLLRHYYKKYSMDVSND